MLVVTESLVSSHGGHGSKRLGNPDVVPLIISVVGGHIRELALYCIPRIEPQHFIIYLGRVITDINYESLGCDISCKTVINHALCGRWSDWLFIGLQIQRKYTVYTC